jgi:hypothetical protein
VYLTAVAGGVPAYSSAPWWVVLVITPLLWCSRIEILVMVYTHVLGELDVNIFVGNLAFTTTEQALRQLFESYGTVDRSGS